ncbi:MAG: NAD(P)-dependent oxidoreductase [Pseudonocardiales bacterium]|nr:MAG: NAD(P)-dependent oxidoreductase [Pseudonocardiales bacterium]
MGAPMARHLVERGFTVHGFDVRPAALANLESAGGLVAGSPAALASAVQVVITSLPSSAALDSVINDDDGLIAGASPGLTVVETSTLSIAAKEQGYAELARSGITMLDCPLSGTASQMETRDVAVYASGDRDALARQQEVLAAFSRAQYNVGRFGNGTKLKLIANHLVTIHNVAAAEALLLAERAGLDLEFALAALTDGAGSSRMLEVRGPMMVAKDFSRPNMRLDGYVKDIDLIGSFGRDLECPLPLFAACAQLYFAALAQGRHAEDPAVVHAVLATLVNPDVSQR